MSVIASECSTVVGFSADLHRCKCFCLRHGRKGPHRIKNPYGIPVLSPESYSPIYERCVLLYTLLYAYYSVHPLSGNNSFFLKLNKARILGVLL